ncbi:MAG: hypothetical protein IT425_07900 [Pirellulales bacterium]|nr:hypothetical protein [Pirellulales bacterium]
MYGSLRSCVLTAFFVSQTASAAIGTPTEPPSVEARTVDFRYSLPWWQTAICMPDDPDKTLVGKEGQALFDYGREGGYRKFGICMQPDLASGTRWVRQQTHTARVPIVETEKEAGPLKVLEEAFVVVPTKSEPEEPARFERLDGDNCNMNWCKPARACPAGFCDIMLANNGELRYHLRVPKKARMTIVFGVCEGWHKEAGKRPLVLGAEGAVSRTVDPIKDFGPSEPGLYRVKSEDTNGDGFIDLSVGTPRDTADRNAILNMLWAFEGDPPNDEAIFSQPENAYAFLQAGLAMPERRVVVLMTLKNTSSEPVSCQPTMRVQSVSAWSVLPVQGTTVVLGSTTRLTATCGIDTCEPRAKGELLVSLPTMTLPANESAQVAFVIDRNSKTAIPAGDSLGAKSALNVSEVVSLRDAARDWWEKLDLPYSTVQIPDAGIQQMIESSVRNIWQAREIKQGRIAFHVGPTCYRSLFIVDGSFLLESAAMLGRGQDARAGVEYMLSKQKPDGGFELLHRYWKENGIVCWAATRHAFLTQDKDWLRTKWPALRRVIENTKALRAEASKDPNALDYRLLPAGFTDGGLSEYQPEYSNVQWNLVGMKAAIAAAHWLGETEDESAWQKEYDDFYATFCKAAERDMLKDKFGNAYLPTMMGNYRNHTPQKGQWSFCHAIYPGQVFAIDDPLAQGQMNMLRATKVEGLVCDTGWMRDGLWTYFASFYAHAALWMGHGGEAAQMLYDYANHAVPTRVWREEQKPVGKGNDEVGDMPHNWASAEFIRLTIHLLEIDRGDELHLLEGMPAEWLKPSMTTRLNGVATPFGPLDMIVAVSGDGKTAVLEVKPLADNCKAVVVHLPGGGRREIAPQQGGKRTFALADP